MTHVTPRSRAALILLLALVLPALLAAADGVPGRHPMDALSAEEIAAAVKILAAEKGVEDGVAYSAITLYEPSKEAVRAWRPGRDVGRAAEVILRREAKTYEAIVDLTTKSVRRFAEVPGAQPNISITEFIAAMQAAVGDERMQEGFAERGITKLDKLFCAPRSVGNFGRPAERERRIVKVDCFDIRNVRTDAFATPIEGLFATVDLDRNEVIEVTDLGVVPIPPGNHDIDAESVRRSLGGLREARPGEFAFPQGSNLEIRGSWVEWQKWSFHVRFDGRMGVVLSLVGFDDGNGPRSVLYQGSMSEIFVPYQDPTVGWHFRNYMDQGEYGLGVLASELVPGAGCPRHSSFLSPVTASVAGTPSAMKNRICLFERPTGDPLWRHAEALPASLESRQGLELVVRFIATVGNYDYVFDWLLDQRGTITFRGGATGIDSVKGVRSLSLADASAAEETAWGPLIAPGRAGINHDHFFSIRLDLDVDGEANTFVRDRLVAERMPETSPRRSLWRVRPQAATSDAEARFRLDYQRPSLWRVVNSHKKNGLGYPVSYALQTAGNALPVVDTDDPPLSRALFANHHLWVTPYHPDERFAAGKYPNQSEPGQGLPAWTANGRAIEDRDIVLWYTLGFHHVPSAEDWPVYNLGWHSVSLRPYNFFDRNPALDVPPPAAESEVAEEEKEAEAQAAGGR